MINSISLNGSVLTSEERHPLLNNGATPSDEPPVESTGEVRNCCSGIR